MRASRYGVAATFTALALFLFLVHLWATRQEDADNGVAINAIIEEAGPSRPLRSRPQSSSLDEQIRNTSLGFEHIFVLNLPSRGDRLDGFVLTSSVTGFDAEVVPGVNGSKIPYNSLPTTNGLQDEERDATLGTWRAHLNVAREVVQRRLSSALIIEDDSDWDVSLKDRLVDFAQGTRYFSEGLTGKESRTPYGDAWDLLWPGHCACRVQVDSSPSGAPSETARKRFIIDNDGTVPVPKNRVNFDQVPDMSYFPNTTRVVYKADSGVCLYAYALSFTGAQKVLRAQATLKKWRPIDLGIGEMCESSENPFTCFGIFPQIVDTHKMAGSYTRDSNINTHHEDKIRETAYTFNVIHSTRMSVDRILRGESPVSQWKDEAEPEVKPGGTTYRIVDVDEIPREQSGNVGGSWDPSKYPDPEPDDDDAQLTSDKASGS